MKTNIDGNKLIAKFMGWVDSPYEHLPDKMYSKDLSEGKHLELFNYHESWNELMPVVEKIEQPNYDYFVHILGNGCFITTCSPNLYRNGSETIVESIIVENSKIESVWLACVEFIKWFNQNNSEIQN